MTRFLVISDIHLHLWNYGNVESRLVNDTQDIYNALAYGYDNNVDAVLFCGDIFHTHGNINTIVLNALFNTLTKFRHWMFPKTIFIPGNHDLVYKTTAKVNSICFLEYFGKVVTAQSTVGIKNFPIVSALPYTENESELNSFLNTLSDDSIVMMHQGVSGVEVNSKGFTLNELLKPALVPDNILHAFTGHYHTRKPVSDKLTIPGALVQHNFGDAGEQRGFLDVTVSGRNLEILFIESKNHTRFVKKSFSDNLIKELEWAPVHLCIEDVPINRLTELKSVLEMKEISAKIVTQKIDNIEFQKTEKSIKSLDAMFDLYIKNNLLDADLSKIGKGLIDEASKTIPF